MRYVPDDIEAAKLANEIARRGIGPRQRLRVTLETLDDLPMARIAEEGRAFAFPADEPDLYTEADLRHRNA
ncbi:MAG TPA: hypothetical protein VMH86_12040 [Rhizomicrobium sp.]|nr:hypothetical protein [Rhizomicrobium sp.]